MADKSKPMHEERSGAILVKVWTNVSPSGERWFTLTMSRLYKNKQGRWMATSSYKACHVPDVVKAFSAATKWIEERTFTNDGSELARAFVRMASKEQSVRRSA